MAICEEHTRVRNDSAFVGLALLFVGTLNFMGSHECD
jgi:hypothetical protein